MARSILIVKYALPLGIGELRNKLSRKKFKIMYSDKNDPEKKIELTQEISEVKPHPFGVQGNIKYRYQKKNEFSEDDRFDVTHTDFAFLFSPSSKIVILLGAPILRSRLMQFFTDILHDGDNPFESITIKKDKMHDLMTKILEMKSGKNNLEGASFFHHAKPLGTLKKLSFTTVPGACGTEHRLFPSHYNNCTHWNCTLRVYKCNGLLDDESDNGYMLTLKKDATASFTIDKSLTEWNRFVVETMKPVLKF